MWINLKNEYEVKLNRLSAEYQKNLYANTNFLNTGLKILDLYRKASFPATELSAEEVANIIRETYLSATAKDKSVKVEFKEPFATIENLVKLAKKEIAEVGFAEFKSAIISSKDKCIESIKKEPLGGVCLGYLNCNQFACIAQVVWLLATLYKLTEIIQNILFLYFFVRKNPFFVCKNAKTKI